MIRCDKLTLAYDGQTVVSELSMEIAAGDYLCIVGENGSGKTTLMKAILGILKPASGTILYEDIRQNEIGYLPQQSEIQRDLSATVREIVLSGTLGRSRSLFYTKAQKKICQKNLELLSMDSLADCCYRELSGGQQQRALLARALCATTQLIVLDEPVTGLDPLATEELYRTIERLNREEHITIIMVSHDISAAMRYANRILHLDHQRRFFGTAEEYAESDLCRRFLKEERI